MAILEVINLKKSFGAQEVLKGINFEMDKGEVVVIIGSSANKKSPTGVRAGRARLEGEESIHCLRCAPQALTFCYYNSTV